VVRHAPGARAEVEVRVAEREAVVRVRDSGALEGSEPARARDVGGLGLMGMRERAELLGGSLRAEPDGAGWLVEFRLPLEEQALPDPAPANRDPAPANPDPALREPTRSERAAAP